MVSWVSGIIDAVSGFANSGTIGLLSNVSGLLGAAFGDSTAAGFTEAGSQYMTSKSLLATGKQYKLDYYAQADRYDFDAETSLVNATIARNNYIYQEQKAFATEEQMRRAIGKVKGTARATYAASGVRSDGSVQDVVQDIANEGMLEVALYDFDSRFKLTGFATQEEQYKREAEYNTKAANTARANADEIYKSYEEAANITKGVAIGTGINTAVDAVIDIFKTDGLSKDLDKAIANNPDIF